MSDLELASEGPVPGRDALVESLRRRERRGAARRVGVELELHLVRARDLSPVAHEGPSSVARLLERLVAEGGWEARPQGHGLERAATGDRVALEPGGQVELVTPPLEGAAALARRLRSLLDELAVAAQGEGLLLLGGGLQPFARLSAFPRVPKERYAIMRRRFGLLRPAWRYACSLMMHATASIQASFDWDDEPDGARLLEAMLRTAPPLAALLASSPVERGRPTSLASRRLAIWRDVDPARSGLVPGALSPGFGYAAWTDWALDVPLLLRVREGRYVDPGRGTFRRVLERGWPDGARATWADWVAHRSGIFTHARWKDVVEHRPLDGPLPEDVLAVPALLVGLLEHRPSRDEALARLSWAGREDLDRGLELAAREGLAAWWGESTLGDEARALVGLARLGLEARVRAGLEPEEAVQLLAPLERRAATGTPPALDLVRAFARGGAWALAERLRHEPGSPAHARPRAA